MPVASLWPLPVPIVSAPGGFAAPQLTSDDFVTELGNLFPPGKAWAWARDPSSVGYALLQGLADSQAATHARKNQLLVDAFPATTVELLPEWQSSVGLPDPCAGPDQSYAEAIAHLLAKIENKGGQSIPYLIAYAAALGFVITITQFTVARYGMRYGTRYWGVAWANTIYINAPETTITVKRYGSSRYGDRYRIWGNAVLQCELQRVAPGHLTLIFAYGG